MDNANLEYILKYDMKYKTAQNITPLYIPCAELEKRGGGVLDTSTPFKKYKT